PGWADWPDILRQTTAGLARLGGGRRPVLLVDDAHLLDNASATLVHQLATTRAAFVLATVANGQAAPDSVIALWKDGPAGRLEVAGLPASAMHELVAAALLGRVDPATANELVERAQGDAVVLRELIAGALDAGVLADEEGIWRLRTELAPSERLIALV